MQITGIQSSELEESGSKSKETSRICNNTTHEISSTVYTTISGLQPWI